MIFEINKDNEPVIVAESLTIPTLRKLWDRDSDEYKVRANKELAYVYHMVSPKSPWFNERKEDREKYLSEDYLDGKEPDDDILKAIELYTRLHDTPAKRAVTAAEGVLDKLTDYFENVDFTLFDERGKQIYDPKSVIATMGNIKSALKTIEELKRKLIQESLEDDTKGMGTSEFSALDKKRYGQ